MVGAHVRAEDPLQRARELGVDAVQFFLSDPQKWGSAQPPARAGEFGRAGVATFVHSPYVLNVASLNNRIRIPSRKAVVQHARVAAEVGAGGLVVHGGHVRKDEDPADGLANWRKLFERQAAEGGFGVPILIENTAGGDAAMARHLDMLARLWEQVGEFGAGFCLDTCHAFAAGWELDTVVERVTAITGRIDLVHLNNSRDAFGSTRDRHANLVGGAGTIDPARLAEVAAAANAPVILETPPEGQPDDVAFLRGL